MTAQTSNRQPTHRLYTVTGDDQHAKWFAIGAAWPHRSGDGYSLQLDALPLGGRIVMLEIAASESGGQR